MNLGYSIIITSRSEFLLNKILRSIQTWFRSAIAFEIVLVVQSDGHSFQVNLDKWQFRHIKIVNAGFLSLSSARNLGVSVAIGERILFLDDDIHFSTYFSFEDIGCIADAGSFVLFNEDDYTPIVKPFNENLCSILEKSRWRYFMGGAILIRKDLFDDLGGFDTSLGVGTSFGSGEETDLFFRLHGRGIKPILYSRGGLLHPRVDNVTLSKETSYNIGQGFMSMKMGVFSFRFYFCFIRPMLFHSLSIVSPMDNRSRATHLRYIGGLLKGVQKYVDFKFGFL